MPKRTSWGRVGRAYLAGAVLPGTRRRGQAARTTRSCSPSRAHGATTAQIRLAWTLQRGPNVLAIPGTGNPDHLTANVAVGALRLSPDDMHRLDALNGR
jgi:pyridoxine 4-dehydrogenase